MRTRLLVTGASGQLGGALALLAPEAVVLGRAAMDFDRPQTIAPAFAAAAPGLVVNAAAYTRVDDAERERAAAFRANAEAPAILAGLCASAGVPFVHVSTDYVFDGSKGAPYRESDPPAPLGAYGASKRAGEEAVLACCPRAIILRTAWVYSARGRNFVRTMLAAARAGRALRVVADQRGTPTAAEDLAELLLDLVAKVDAGAAEGRWGIYHAAGSGEASWLAFAEAIFAEAARFGVPVPPIAAITTADWPTRARRPADSRLDCGKLFDVFGLALPPWRESLARVVAALCAA